MDYKIKRLTEELNKGQYQDYTLSEEDVERALKESDLDLINLESRYRQHLDSVLKAFLRLNKGHDDFDHDKEKQLIPILLDALVLQAQQKNADKDEVEQVIVTKHLFKDETSLLAVGYGYPEEDYNRECIKKIETVDEYFETIDSLF